MKKTANARFSIKNWDEKPYSEGNDLSKMTRASEYVMMYRNDGTAAFVGLERITGRIAGRKGSFVLQRTGVFEDGSQGILLRRHRLGGGELRSLRGKGSLRSVTRPTIPSR